MSTQADHSRCLQFPVDFDTQKTLSIPIGRLALAENFIVRMVMTQKGLVLVVSQSAIDRGALLLTPPDEAEFSFVGPAKKEESHE